MVVFMKYYMLIFFIVIILSGCCSSYDPGSLQRTIITKKNPVSYIYHSNIQNIFKIFQTKRLEWKQFFPPVNEDVMNDYSINMYDFSVISNNNDTSLIEFHDKGFSWIGQSASYRTEKKYLNFTGDFYFMIKKIDSNSTELTVRIKDMNILFGREFNMHCFCCAYNFKSVEPTGVEEYLFLHKIGEMLGEKNMPELILPEFE